MGSALAAFVVVASGWLAAPEQPPAEPPPAEESAEDSAEETPTTPDEPAADAPDTEQPAAEPLPDVEEPAEEPTEPEPAEAEDAPTPEGPPAPTPEPETLSPKEAKKQRRKQRAQARRDYWSNWRKSRRRPEPVIDDTCLPGESGCFLEDDGTVRHAGRAYRLHRSGFDPRYFRASLEAASLVAAGVIWYWADKEHNLADWDYPSWQQRFTKEAVRFDNNDFPMNSIYHPVAGGGYYLFARVNDIRWGWSFLYSTMASLTWEYVFEFREKVSINDMLMTSPAGMVMGEFWYKLGKYVTSGRGKPRGGQAVAAWTLGFFQSVNDAMSHKPPPDSKHLDEWGLDADFAHDFRLTQGLAYVEAVDRDDILLTEFRFRGELIDLPGYQRDGQFVRPFWGGDYSRLEWAWMFADGGYGVDLDSHMMLLGVHSQNLRTVPNGRRGHSMLLGGTLAYKYRWERYTSWKERLALLHMPGPNIESDVFLGPVQIHTSAQVHFDFAAIDAPLYSRWAQLYPDEHGKAILRKQSYYFGWGFSTRLELEFRFPYVAVGGRTFFGYYNSAEGYDRTQEEVTLDERVEDYAFDYEAWLRIKPWRFGVIIKPSLQGRWRSEYMGDLHDIREQRRYMMNLGFVW